MDIKYLTEVNQVLYWLTFNEVIMFKFKNWEGFIQNNPDKATELEYPFKIILQRRSKGNSTVREVTNNESGVTEFITQLKEKYGTVFYVCHGAYIKIEKYQPKSIWQKIVCFFNSLKKKG